MLELQSGEDMNIKEEEPSTDEEGDVDMAESYMDRLVHQVGGMEDSDDDEDFADDDEMIESDDENEYVSDDDEKINIYEGGYQPNENVTNGQMSEESKALLLWRQAKEESFSDWYIEVGVVKEGGETSTVYNVHRCVLAAGPKKSGYFETLFKSDQFKKSGSSSSKVDLSEDIARYFPAFLDYLYAHPTECQGLVNSDNWYALWYLADYFVVPTLTDAVNGFIEKDMHNLERLEKYLSPDNIIGDGSENNTKRDFLLRTATKACAEMILFVEADSPLLSSMPPAMFLQVMKSVKSSKNMKSLSGIDQKHICDLAISYIRAHKNILNGNYFNILVQELYLPDDCGTLAGLVAIDLFEIMKDTGWNYVDGCDIKSICTVVLSKYISSTHPSVTKIRDIMGKVPDLSVVAPVLLGEALQSNKSLESRSLVISFRLINPEKFNLPAGERVTLHVESTDTINYIKYLVSREFNLLFVSRIELSKAGSESVLNDDELVSNCGISSGAELEITANTDMLLFGV